MLETVFSLATHCLGAFGRDSDVQLIALVEYIDCGIDQIAQSR
jgi:hypothetical protein